MHQQITAIRMALLRNRAASNRHQAARARHDMRTWQVERRKRTRHLIELGGLVVKAGIVDLTGDDRTTIFGALLWSADKLKSDQGERARALWTARGKAGTSGGPGDTQGNRSNCSSSSSLTYNNGMSAERRVRGSDFRACDGRRKHGHRNSRVWRAALWSAAASDSSFWTPVSPLEQRAHNPRWR
jgi:Conjugal transfer protein TraD